MSDLELLFDVEGDPVPQPRPKARRIGNGIQIYTPSNARVKTYKEGIQERFKEFASCLPHGFSSQEELNEFLLSPDMSVKLQVVYFLKRPQHMIKSDSPMEPIHHIKKPDLDNLLKGTMDALTGLAWLDDSKVYSVSARKYYTSLELGGKSGRKRISTDAYQSICINYFLH